MSSRAGIILPKYSRPVARGCCQSNPWTRLRWASSSTRQWSTPLAKNLAEVITVSDDSNTYKAFADVLLQTTGPISLAAYMRQCLTSTDGGYYTTSQKPGKDQFGQKGDFITSPEISQIFGELLGIWLVTEWMAQGRTSSGVEIIEVGPGRGTLMDDILRVWYENSRTFGRAVVLMRKQTVSNFKSLAGSIDSVYLVEASSALRDQQKQILCGDVPLEKTDIGFQSMSKHSKVPITWCEDIRFVPNDPSKTPFIFAHEFFDALPIHAFQSVASNPNEVSQTLETPTGPLPLSKPSPQSKTPQWRELVVTPTLPPSNITTTTTSSSTSKPHPDFQLSLAKASTPPSLYLPILSPRYKALLPSPGSTIEISPESHSYATDFARRIGGIPPSKPSSKPTTTTSPPNNPPPSPASSPKPKPSGAALIIDYGPATTIPTSTLRGIRSHKLVSPFSSPGLVDISADVDFTALAEAALEASEGVEVHGPVEQGIWLERMGIRERGEMLCRGLEKEKGGDGGGEGAEEAKKRVRGAIERLVEKGGGAMGKIYKVLAIVPERGGKRPVGFGGGVM
ncbi:hypothetical protein ACLMJK_004455 [Lecanora helva]